MTSRGRVAFLMSFLALSLSAAVVVKPLKGQVLYGSLLGTVTDQSGAVLPGAHITVVNSKTGLKREADSDSSGLYSIPNLPEGTYDLTAGAKGFKEYKQTGVEVGVGGQVRVDIKMEVGLVSQEVTVSSSAAVLQTTKAEVSTSLSTVAIENLPTGLYRNFQSLVLLTPGAVDNYGFTGAVADTPERAIAIPINGFDPAFNSTRITGRRAFFFGNPAEPLFTSRLSRAFRKCESPQTVMIPRKGWQARLRWTSSPSREQTTSMVYCSGTTTTSISIPAKRLM